MSKSAPDYWEASRNFTARSEANTQLDAGVLWKAGTLEAGASVFASKMRDFLLYTSSTTVANIDATRFGGEADLVAAVEALLQFDQQALLFGIGWVGFAAAGAVAVGIAAAFQLMTLALTGLQQPRGVLIAAGQGAVEAPAVVGAVVVALDQTAEVLALGQQVFVKVHPLLFTCQAACLGLLRRYGRKVGQQAGVLVV